VNRQYFQQAVLLCLLKAEYAPMLHVSYYAQNYAGKVCQGLGGGGRFYTTTMDTIICLYSQCSGWEAGYNATPSLVSIRI